MPPPNEDFLNETNNETQIRSNNNNLCDNQRVTQYEIDAMKSEIQDHSQSISNINSSISVLSEKVEKLEIQLPEDVCIPESLKSLKLLLPSMKKNEDIIFCYVGGIIDPEYKEKIDSLAEKEKVSDRVIYYGELKPGVELNKFYNMAEAMIFPSKAEGFSLVIIEAMSSGIPVIIKDELEFKLSNECLKFNNIKSFNKILTDTILNEKQHSKLSKNVRNIVLKNYSWDSIAEEYIKN